VNKRKENEENKKSSRWADFVPIQVVVYQAKGFLLLLSNLLPVICQVTLKTVSHWQSRSLFRDRIANSAFARRRS
jgi:hypothetical protein